MRKSLALLLSLIFSIPCAGQNQNDWQSLSQLKPGDKVQVSLADGKSFTGPLQNWTAQQLTVGTTNFKKEDVREVDRYRKGTWSRGKTAALGAAIGFGAGFAMGAAAGPFCVGPGGWGGGACVPRGKTEAVVGVLGLASGAIVGGLLPRHDKDRLYVMK